MAFTAIGLFLLGLIIGSFLNVLIYRIPRRESIIFPPSHCPFCARPLAVKDNIPVVSFLLLRGRCRYCGKPIPLQYPIVEIVTGALFVTLFLKFDLSLKTAPALFFMTVVLLSGAIDLRHQIIPNSIVFPATAIGLILAAIGLLTDFQLVPIIGSPKVWLSVAGFLIGGGILLIPALIKEDWMGAGDIKLMALIGLFLGFYVLLALFVGSLIGAVAGIGLILGKKLKRGQPLPFGPFLALGAATTLFLGPQIWQFYQSLWA